MLTSSSRPSGSPQVLPYLYYPDANEALDFLTEAFGFEEIEALRDESGVVWSAHVSTGDGVVMLGRAMEEFGSYPILDTTRASSRTLVYVDGLDEHFRRSRQAGATILTEPVDHGSMRIYIAADCGSQQWIFATPI